MISFTDSVAKRKSDTIGSTSVEQAIILKSVETTEFYSEKIIQFFLGMIHCVYNLQYFIESK